MNRFIGYKNQQLHIENLNATDLAEQFGSPLYVYSKAALTEYYMAYANALNDTDHLICYAVKANSNIAVLQHLASLGSGFDIVSGGELIRVLKAGGDASKVVFSGVGKTVEEIEFALDEGIACFNIESTSELHRIAKVAATKNMVAPISIRVNPDVDAKTHPYISTGLDENKFGVPIAEAESLYLWAKDQNSLNIIGADCHIGSQLTDTAPFMAALERMLGLIDRLAEQGISLHHLDMGGGLGVQYQNETPPDAGEYMQHLKQGLQSRNLKLLIEPGRSIAANAGVLLTKVEYLKTNQTKNFALIDAAMNDLMRPSLYQAWQRIDKVDQTENTSNIKAYDIVGPVCETGDFLGKDRELSLEPGDLLAVFSAGAYGFSMASNYNTRNRSAEVMVDGDRAYLIRQRETYDYQLALESLLPND